MNCSGCANAPSLMAIVSIGYLGSSEMSKAHKVSAMVMKSDRSARCCPGHILYECVQFSIDLGHRQKRLPDLRPKPQLKNRKSVLILPFSPIQRPGLNVSPSGKTSGSRAIALWVPEL